MRLENVRVVFIAIGLIGVLLIASPTINSLVKPPANQEFSELYILGPSHTLSGIPFNIKAGVNYSVYLGVVNHLGYSCYYSSFVKLGNETAIFPNATLGAPSPLSALYEYKLFLDDNSTWEAPLTFQVGNLTLNDGLAQISNIIINGKSFSVNQNSTLNPDKNGYYYNLLVELWTFNSTLGASKYNNRYVNLILNITP